MQEAEDFDSDMPVSLLSLFVHLPHSSTHDVAVAYFLESSN